jgi:DNA-binding protein HU-beta
LHNPYKFVEGEQKCLTHLLIIKFYIMNKTDLIDAMAEHAGITKAASKKALECALIEIEGALQKGNRVSLVGFGSWSVSKRAARDGRNPQTGATIKIKAKNVVKFKAGSDLSSAVN